MWALVLWPSSGPSGAVNLAARSPNLAAGHCFPAQLAVGPIARSGLVGPIRQRAASACSGCHEILGTTSSDAPRTSVKWTIRCRSFLSVCNTVRCSVRTVSEKAEPRRSTTCCQRRPAARSHSSHQCRLNGFFSTGHTAVTPGIASNSGAGSEPQATTMPAPGYCSARNPTVPVVKTASPRRLEVMRSTDMVEIVCTSGQAKVSPV